MARAHAAAWEAIGAELYFYAPSGSAAVADDFGGTECSSLAALYAAAELVDICAPTPHHLNLARSAVEAHRHVLCEKPLSRSATEGRQMLALAAAHRRLLMPAHVVRYFPQYAAAHQAVEDGRLGAMAVLRFHRSGATPQRPWFTDDNASGGLILDQLVHDIDQAVWMAGPVATVYASENRSERSGAQAQTAHVILTHRSGAVSHCRGHWGAEGTAFSFGFDIAGTLGTLTYDSRKNTGFEMSTTRGASPTEDGFMPDLGYFTNPYEVQARDFLQAAQTGSSPRTSAEEGLYAVQLALAAIRSVAEHRAIDVDDEGDHS
ncbi:Predicted dehydrogenase [Mycetocola miduiensis]|uniref:Predicted dehydrogenase n=2 Tax=Mycetocola miduiensis TaxID=995034 RepID=A0A1I4YPQ6_9MICO|nr:Predicted dehydrogenase [Mycetocola miduiensis]